MKKFIKKMIVLSICLVLLPTSGVKASENQKALGDIAITNESASEVTQYSMLKGVNLWYGTASIVNHGNGLIGAGGTTVARHSLSSLSVSVTVQYYEGGAWKNYHHWTAVAYNTNYVGTSKVLTVPRGKYYCVRAYHSGGGENINSTSNGIWIG